MEERREEGEVRIGGGGHGDEGDEWGIGDGGEEGKIGGEVRGG